MPLQRFNSFQSFIQTWLPDRQVIDRYAGPGKTNPIYKTKRHPQRSLSDNFFRIDNKTRQTIKTKEYSNRHEAILDANIEWFKDKTPRMGGPKTMRELYPEIAAVSDSLTPDSFEIVVYLRANGQYYAVNDMQPALWPEQSIFSRVSYYDRLTDPEVNLTRGFYYLITHLPTNITIPVFNGETYLVPIPSAVPLTNYTHTYDNVHFKTA